MESPIKKLNFDTTDKENQPIDETALAALAEQIDAKQQVPVEKVKAEETQKVEKAVAPVAAPAIKPEEVDEPLLQENPQRFVLFPIKYHEVRDAF
jgi:ribonucleoside-diphosphate reductase subunit M2